MMDLFIFADNYLFMNISVSKLLLNIIFFIYISLLRIFRKNNTNSRIVKKMASTCFNHFMSIGITLDTIIINISNKNLF